MAPKDTLHRISLVRAGITATSAETAQVLGVDGAPLATIDVAPPLLATLTIAGIRKNRPGEAPDPAVLELAGRLFAAAELNGLTPDEYCDLQARASGVPITVVRRTLRDLEETCAQMGERVAAACPPGAAAGVSPGEIGAVWARRGEALAVIAPSNNPGTHTQWVEGLAFGYRLVVRPGTKDPFTPARLIAAILEAGLEPSYLSMLPGEHATGDALIKAADLSLVFGGDETMKRYAHDRTVIQRGPGRSKVLHTGEVTDDALEVICASVGYDAGLRCTNATAVFTEADPGELGDAVARRLAELTPAPPQSPAAQLPVMPVGKASGLRAHLESRRAGAIDVAAAHYPDGVLTDLGDGSAVLRPAVLVCDRSDHPGAGIELPFPCVWILPWSREGGLAPLRNTLALTILSDDEGLASAALREPSIRKVLLGPLPTYAGGAASPHDGYLGHDLMEARAYGVAESARVGHPPGTAMA
jgi:hypothetical protein